MNSSERLKIILKELKVTQEEFAQDVGLTQGAVSDIIRGKTKSVSIPIAKLCGYIYGINPLWLLTGDGEMFFDSSVPSDLKSEPEINSTTEHDSNGFKTIEGGAKTPAPHEVTRENLHQSDWFRALSRNKKMVVLLIDAIKDEKFMADAVEYLSFKVEKEKKMQEEMKKELNSQKGEAG